MDEQSARWQARLDKAFPSGAIATWEHPDTVVYPIAWMRVLGMSGLDPIVSMYVGGSPRVLDALVILSWEDQEDGRVRLTFANADPMLLTSKLPAPLAADLARERAEIIPSWEGQ